MKKYLSISLFMALILATSCKDCRGKLAIGDDTALTEIVVDSDEIIFQPKHLNGTWGESKDEEALFSIVDDSLLYSKNKTEPILIKLDDNKVTVYGTLEFTCTIIKLNKDSLCYIDDITSEITRLTRVE